MLIILNIFFPVVFHSLATRILLMLVFIIQPSNPKKKIKKQEISLLSFETFIIPGFVCLLTRLFYKILSSGFFLWPKFFIYIGNKHILQQNSIIYCMQVQPRYLCHRETNFWVLCILWNHYLHLVCIYLKHGFMQYTHP